MAFIGGFMFNNGVFAQKKLLDHSSVATWPVILYSKISNNGRYVAYKIKTDKGGASLTVQDKEAKWKKEIGGIGNDFQFMEDSKWIIYCLHNDSIGLLELGKTGSKFIGHVGSFEVPANGNRRWLVCLLKDAQHNLLLMDLQRGTEMKYPNVREFKFNPNGDVLLFQTITTKDTAGKLYWLNTSNFTKTHIGNCDNIFNIAFDKTGTKLAYLSTVKTSSRNAISLYYYEKGMDTARTMADNSSSGMEGMTITSSRSVTFSKMGDKLFFGISSTSIPTNEVSKRNGKVHIKHYQDKFLESEYNSGPFMAVLNSNHPQRIVRLQQNADAPGYRLQFGGGEDDDYVAIESKITGHREESKWNTNARPDIYLVSTKDGSRKLIKKHLASYDDIKFSPTGKYLVWYDRTLKHWFSYNLADGSIKNITRSIKSPLYTKDDHPGLAAPEGIAAWMENDKSVLIYDRYDLWRVDPKGKMAPINISGDYGVNNNIRFRLLNYDQGKQTIVNRNDTLLLTALNLNTKDNGFFRLVLTNHANLQKLLMEPKAYDVPFPLNAVLDLSGQATPMSPQKAKNADTYLLTCMSSTEYPNLYTTVDFKHFKPITDFSPQKTYNWYTSELINWKMFDGKKADGVLYKPENFDPKKKYPVIFYYYEKSADELNFFLNPELSRATINIPWFVSNGYLVFVPDIYYKTGHPGESAYNSIVSAAQMLVKIPWVNAHKMGLQGHSFGGYETNYIVSHSHLFAAAASASGLSDLVSGYSGDSQSFYENLQVRMGSTLWQRPDLYIKNSPIFSANKVTTPIFIMHNQDDGNVPFTQGEEWFSDLVRLGKKVWLISYDGETHTIEEPANKLDYSIRLGQFFDYYLKDAQPPKWMTESGNSLELDNSSKKP